jgi:hypothetical protein
MLDAINGTDKVNKSIENAVLQTYHEKILILMACEIEDLIVNIN